MSVDPEFECYYHHHHHCRYSFPPVNFPPPTSASTYHLSKTTLPSTQGLAFFETSRGALQLPEWVARQLRKIHGAIKAIDGFVKASLTDFLIGDELTIADIAAGCMLGMTDMVETQFGLVEWKGGCMRRWWGGGGGWRRGRGLGRRGRLCLS